MNQHCWLDTEDWVQKADNTEFEERCWTEEKKMKHWSCDTKTKVTESDSQTWRYSMNKWFLNHRTEVYVIWTARKKWAIHESQWSVLTEY